MTFGTAPRALAAFLSCATLCACEDLGEFRTGPDRVFHGEVIGSDTASSAPSFIRQGFASHTEMELTFDPSLAAAVPTGEPGEIAPPVSPGEIHTFTCPSDKESCRTRDRVRGDFDHAALEPIENLMHDPLSEYDFPGGGRIKNYMFGVRFRGDVDGAPVRRHAMVFLSLMESGRVEARVLAPSVLADDGETEALPPLFGVFMLEMHAR